MLLAYRFRGLDQRPAGGHGDPLIDGAHKPSSWLVWRPRCSYCSSPYHRRRLSGGAPSGRASPPLWCDCTALLDRLDGHRRRRQGGSLGPIAVSPSQHARADGARTSHNRSFAVSLTALILSRMAYLYRRGG